MWCKAGLPDGRAVEFEVVCVEVLPDDAGVYLLSVGDEVVFLDSTCEENVRYEVARGLEARLDTPVALDWDELRAGLRRAREGCGRAFDGLTPGRRVATSP